MLQKIHIIVALIAALAITILSLYQDITFYQMSIRLIVIIPVFYLLGLFFRSYLTKLLTPPKEDEMPTEEADTDVISDESSELEAETDELDDYFNL